MPLLDFNFTDAPDLALLPTGQHTLRLLSASVEEVDTKYGPASVLNLRFEPVNEPEKHDDIYHRIFLPKDTDTPKQRAKGIRAIAGFCKAFGISSPFDPATLGNQTGAAMIRCRPATDQYPESNTISRFV